MPRTRKNLVDTTEAKVISAVNGSQPVTIPEQSEQTELAMNTILISDACQQLETTEQTLRLVLQAIRPDDFDSVRAIALTEYEAVAETIQRKALTSAPQPEPQPEVQPEPKTEQLEQPAPLAPPQQPTPPAPVNSMAQALQFALTQQASLSYSDGLKVEAAATEGAATAYREFLAHQQGYSSTAQSLHQLQQALDITRYQKASNELSEVQQAFLSGLQNNSTALQNQQQAHQNLVNSVKTQSRQQMDELNNAVLGAIQDLSQAKDGSESSLL